MLTLSIIQHAINFCLCYAYYLLQVVVVAFSIISSVAMISPESVFTPLEILLQTIYLKFLTNSYCVTIISDSPINFNIQSGVLYITYNASDNPEYKILQALEIGCSDYIVHLDNPEEFMKTYEYVNHKGNIRRSNRKIIFLPTDKTSKLSLLNIFNMKEASFVPNLVIVLSTEGSRKPCEVFDLLTHKYVGPVDLASQPLCLDQWNSCAQKFSKNANLFPHNMNNLQGKLLNVATFNYKPYAILDLNPEEVPTKRDGTEIRIVEQFCSWINCTVNIVRGDNDIYQWGELYENETGTGVMGCVVEDRADIGIGALYSWYEMFSSLDYSIPSVRTAVTCIAPSPRLLDSWEMPLLPFSWMTWLALIVTFIFASVAISFTKGSAEGAFLFTFGMILMQSRDEIVTTWRMRTITVWLLLAGLVLGNAYGAGLAATFTVPKYEPSIDKIQDLLDRKMEWIATADAWIFSLLLSSDPSIKKLVSQFKTYTSDVLEKKTFDRSSAIAIEKLPAGYFAIGEYITKEAVRNLMIMREDFYYEYVVAMLRKSSPYTQKLNELIGRLHQSGLLLAWETQVVLKHVDFKVQLEVKLSRSQKDTTPIIALSFRHVVGIFILYLTGVVLSTLLFFLELWFAKKQRKLVVPTRKLRF